MRSLSYYTRTALFTHKPGVIRSVLHTESIRIESRNHELISDVHRYGNQILNLGF